VEALLLEMHCVSLSIVDKLVNLQDYCNIYWTLFWSFYVPWL